MNPEDEIDELRQEIKELKKQNRLLAEAFLNHIKGRMTVEDLETCYQALNKVKKFTSGIGGSYRGGGGIEQIIAEKMLAERDSGVSVRKPEMFENMDEKEVKEIMDELSKKKEKGDKKGDKKGDEDGDEDDRDDKKD